jgi:hypothetical protein
MSDANSPRTHGQCIYISSNFPQERSAIKDFTPIIECVKVDFASKSISDMTDEEMDQLMKRTIRTIQYTTNIPIISQPLDDGSALDFGVIAPNPSTVVKAQLDKCIYFSPVDIEGNHEEGLYAMISYNRIITDIMTICNRFGKNRTFYTITDVMNFIKAGDGISSYCIVIYSTNHIRLPIDSFNENGVWHYMNITKTATRFKLYF